MPEPSRGRARMAERLPTAFLCHASADKPFVERLASDLRAQGLGVWFDKWEINVGDSIVEMIATGLQEDDYLVVVLSPDALESLWVRKELNAALVREISERRVVVLPVLYRRCPVPTFLREKRYADFTVSYEAGLDALIGAFERPAD